MEKDNNKPAFEHRIGSVRVTVWENEGKGGERYHSVSLVRRFKSGDEWSNTSSFTGLSDLAHLIEGAEIARQWLRLRLLGDSVEV